MTNKGNTIVKELRRLYAENDWKNFFRIYSLGRWMIDKEELEKINEAIRKKGYGDRIPVEKKKQTAKQMQMLDDAMEAFPGSRIIDRIS